MSDVIFLGTILLLSVLSFGLIRFCRLADWRKNMSTTEIIALIISAALLVYLSAALLKPGGFHDNERFYSVNSLLRATAGTRKTTRQVHGEGFSRASHVDWIKCLAD